MRGHKGGLLGSYQRSDDCGVEVCWGATYMLRPDARPAQARARAWAACALLLPALALTLAACRVTERAVPGPLSAAVASGEYARPYQGRNAVFAYPEDVALVSFIRAASELRDTRLMLADAAHLLPEHFAPPRTSCIATRGRGMVPVRSLDLRATDDTIDALRLFFTDSRQRGADGLAVWQAAAPSPSAAPEDAELLLGCCVELRVINGDAPDTRPLRATPQGRYLLTHAWQYGFIRCFAEGSDDPAREHRFRYVGLAHSVAMTELGLDLKGYLELLHEQRVVTIQKNGIPRYVIVCQPIVDGYASLWLPKAASVQAGVDNMGYAVVACVLP